MRRSARRLVGGLLGVVLVSAGCATDVPGQTSAGASTDPGAASAAATAPGASPTASAAPTAPVAAPSFAFSFDEEPVVTRELTGIDERYINPGAVIEVDGALHMFANLFTAWPGHVSVVHLRSSDGTAWELAQPEPVLTRDDVSFATTGIDVSTGFVDTEGRWVLVFETVENSKPWVIGRAIGPGPDGPWTVDPEPILEPGATGDWDAGGLSWPSVVATDDGYAMYYTGLDRPRGTGAIGLATSIDGETWTKHPGPVLAAEVNWERGKVDRPRVVRTLDGFVMVYAGGQLTDRGMAWSDDGVAWGRDGDVPAIEQDDFPVDGRAWDAALLERNGQLWYFLEIGAATGTGGTQIYLARASIP
jgi:predicted GH43/DUF377 family glycosyl hydrolase